MASVNIPTGRIQWEGTNEDLRENTEITVITERNGEVETKVMPLSRMIAMTNGQVLEYLP